MFRKKKSDERQSDASAQALVRQDPRTKVKTTSAQTNTTNTSVQNATIFNSNTNTVTFQTTRQTVTHTQQARVTEMVTRRTPTVDELEELLRQMNMNRNESANRRSSGNFSRSKNSTTSNINGGISAKSETKFKSNADIKTGPVKRLILTYDSPHISTKKTTNNTASGNVTPITPKTPTLVTIQEMSFSEKSGRAFTTTTETQRFKMRTKVEHVPENKGSPSYKQTDAQPFWALKEPTAVSKSTYVSPYLNRSLLKTTNPTTTNNYKTVTPTTSLQANYKPTYSFNNVGNSNKKFNFSTEYKPSTTTSAQNFTTTQPSFSTKFSTPIVSNLKPSVAIVSNNNNNNDYIQKSTLKPARAYIINNEIFDNPNNETRTGSREDVKLLCETFEMFKLKTNLIENAPLKKIHNLVAKIASKDFSQYSGIVIVILSHGNRYEEIAAKDGSFSIDDDILFPILRNPTLTEKPKLFFIQACKGAMQASSLKKDAVSVSGTPTEILKCYSTFEGYVSYRSENGSIFIQNMCKNIQLLGGTKNIKEIMEKVTSIVKKESANKQIPTITSTLTKPYIFGDYV